jgi:hypothetical protein
VIKYKSILVFYIWTETLREVSSKYHTSAEGHFQNEIIDAGVGYRYRYRSLLKRMTDFLSCILYKTYMHHHVLLVYYAEVESIKSEV